VTGATVCGIDAEALEVLNGEVQGGASDFLSDAACHP
jgi:hypothetical protein